MNKPKTCVICIALICGMNTMGIAKNYYIGSFADPKINPHSIMLDKVEELTLTGGDTLFLSGIVLKGKLSLKNIFPKDAPLVITSYEKTPTLINATGESEGILLENCGNIIIENISVKADGRGDKTPKDDPAVERKMRCGVLIHTTMPGEYSNITLNNVSISNVFFEDKGFIRNPSEVRTANGTQTYGWGIRIINTLRDAIIKKVIVSHCKIQNVAHTGLKFSGTAGNIQDIEVYKNDILNTGGPGIQMSGVWDAHIHHNVIDRSGSNDDSRKWGRGSGYWCWGAKGILLEHNRLLNANGPGDSAGAHIDYNCSDIIYQYNFSYNNAGAFCEILGNNYNCIYRYNISVNDGWRQKGKDGAFQEGKVLWFSGYAGNKKRKGPYNCYVYNNTICVTSYEDVRIAIGNTSDGLLIANNIFYFKSSYPVLGDQYNPEKKGNLKAKNVLIKHNLFLNKASWNKQIPVQCTESFVGNPEFTNYQGKEAADFIPKSKKMVKNKGIVISPLLGDSAYTKDELNVKYDILGRKIKGKPDLGAIELK